MNRLRRLQYEIMKGEVTDRQLLRALHLQLLLEGCKKAWKYQ